MLVKRLGAGTAAALAVLQLGTGGASAQTSPPAPVTAPPTPPAAPAAAPNSARARANLASYVSAGDYPEEAIRRGEQGTVGFRLEVDTEGKVTRCVIVQSSASAILDKTTCRIMTERARFEPARDSRGRAVPDSVQGRIRWVLPEGEDFPPRLQTLLMLWSGCVAGEAAKLVPGDLPVNRIAEKAFPPCAALEALFAREAKLPLPLVEPRKGMMSMIETMVPQTRNALKAVPEESAPPQP